MQKTVEETVSNGLPEDKKDVIFNILSTRIDIFRTSFSSCPSTKILAKPTRAYFSFRLSIDRRRHGILQLLGRMRLRTAIGPTSGPVEISFPVDLRPVNRFTIKHQFPMPNLEQELTNRSE